jgi:hypothetical protein
VVEERLDDPPLFLDRFLIGEEDAIADERRVEELFVPVPAAWSVTTIAFIVRLPVSSSCLLTTGPGRGGGSRTPTSTQALRHQQLPTSGRSIYGAKRAQPVATSGKWAPPKTAQTSRSATHGNPRQPFRSAW